MCNYLRKPVEERTPEWKKDFFAEHLTEQELSFCIVTPPLFFTFLRHICYFWYIVFSNSVFFINIHLSKTGHKKSVNFTRPGGTSKIRVIFFTEKGQRWTDTLFNGKNTSYFLRKSTDRLCSDLRTYRLPLDW